MGLDASSDRHFEGLAGFHSLYVGQAVAPQLCYSDPLHVQHGSTTSKVSAANTWGINRTAPLRFCGTFRQILIIR